MRLLIMGATGGTGRELVKQALLLGHQVTAFARTPEKLGIAHENLRAVKGDLLEPASIGNAIAGQEAVISALGSPGLGKSTVLSDGTRQIVRFMEMEGIKRLVFESSIGIGDSWDHLPWFTRWIFVPLVIRNIFADKEIQERIIIESDLDWVIVRPGRLTNGPPRGTYRVGDEISETARAGAISRADVAEFMLRQLTSDEFVGKMPGISY